jgi:hypothetical protein
MRGRILAGLALVAALGACGQQGSDNPTVHSVQIGNQPYACFKAGDMNIGQPTTEVKGALRAKLLTPQAVMAGVRVFVTGTDINQYGQLVLNYTDAGNTCTLWSEGLTVQEYSQKLGLNPVGVSPFYEATPAPKPPVAPATTPTPTATPTPVAQ